MSIWKTPDQKPKQEELVAWEDINGIHAGRFDTCYNCFCTCADYRADLRKAKKWCSLENLEDLIAQADKAERLQKAVDLAVDVLVKARGRRELSYCGIWFNKISIDELYSALDEIKQLIKGE